ncbi:MAG: hypothetical protein HC896_12080 [Bacteroidales bacterium]|nr:hypothetical protein [Bacteroidales bacterium]
MDTKVTLHFDQDVIEKAKRFAANNNISLSRLTEFLYRNITSNNYKTLEELPIADWVGMVAEGEAQYKRRSNKETAKEYFNSKK